MGTVEITWEFRLQGILAPRLTRVRNAASQEITAYDERELRMADGVQPHVGNRRESARRSARTEVTITALAT